MFTETTVWRAQEVAVGRERQQKSAASCNHQCIMADMNHIFPVLAHPYPKLAVIPKYNHNRISTVEYVMEFVHLLLKHCDGVYSHLKQ